MIILFLHDESDLEMEGKEREGKTIFVWLFAWLSVIAFSGSAFHFA